MSELSHRNRPATASTIRTEESHHSNHHQHRSEMKEQETHIILGQGVIGITVLVRDLQQNQKVVKQVDLQEFSQSGQKRVLKEISSFAAFQSIHLVKIVQCTKKNEKLAVTCEYCDGNNLRGKLMDYKKNGNRIRQKDAVRWLTEINEGLKFLHRRDLFHGDLKPENILFDEHDDLKLCDYGYRDMLAWPLNKRTSHVKTLQYVAPEIILGKAYVIATDMWSVGVIAYEMIMLEPPYRGSKCEGIRMKILFSESDLSPLESRVDLKLFRLISNWLQREPEKRPTSGKSIKTLKSITEQSTESECSETSSTATMEEKQITSTKPKASSQGKASPKLSKKKKAVKKTETSQSLTSLRQSSSSKSVSTTKKRVIIGQGIFGTVQVFLNPDKKLVAEKEVNMSRFSVTMKRNVLNAVKIMEKLQHPNIVTFLGSDTTEKKITIHTEYMNGGDLHRRIQTCSSIGSYFEEKLIFNYFKQLLTGLEYVHKMKIIHRDINPQNILISHDGQSLKISGFLMSSDQEEESNMAGTPHYMAPEVVMKQNYNYKCDIWSLGVTIYELAELRKPFPAIELEELFEQIKDGTFDTMHQRFASPLSSLIDSMLDRNSDNRPECSEMLYSKIFETGGFEDDL